MQKCLAVWASLIACLLSLPIEFSFIYFLHIFGDEKYWLKLEHMFVGFNYGLVFSYRAKSTSCIQ